LILLPPLAQLLLSEEQRFRSMARTSSGAAVDLQTLSEQGFVRKRKSHRQSPCLSPRRRSWRQRAKRRPHQRPRKNLTALYLLSALATERSVLAKHKFRDALQEPRKKKVQRYVVKNMSPVGKESSKKWI
jgi:hypothetical protein